VPGYVDENENNMIDNGEPCPRCVTDGWQYVCTCSDPPRMAVDYYQITPRVYPYYAEFFVYVGAPNFFLPEFIKIGEQ
jgi:hypothetical protein